MLQYLPFVFLLYFFSLKLHIKRSTGTLNQRIPVDLSLPIYCSVLTITGFVLTFRTSLTYISSLLRRHRQSAVQQLENFLVFIFVCRNGEAIAFVNVTINVFVMFLSYQTLIEHL